MNRATTPKRATPQSRAWRVWACEPDVRPWDWTSSRPPELYGDGLGLMTSLDADRSSRSGGSTIHVASDGVRPEGPTWPTPQQVTLISYSRIMGRNKMAGFVAFSSFEPIPGRIEC